MLSPVTAAAWAAPDDSGGRGDLPALQRALLLQRAGDEEGKLERLAGIETRIAMGVVAVGERLLRHRLGAADAFGDVLARHLDMDAAGMGALGLMGGEEGAHLGEHPVE